MMLDDGHSRLSRGSLSSLIDVVAASDMSPSAMATTCFPYWTNACITYCRADLAAIAARDGSCSLFESWLHAHPSPGSMPWAQTQRGHVSLRNQ